MIKTSVQVLAVTVLMGTAAPSLPAPALAGNGVGAGLVGFGIGAVVGSALAPREVYVIPAPPPPAYYGPAAYVAPPWTPDWYTYCAHRYRNFNPHTGYFVGPDGQPYFCR
jgi:BA14K-like protein